MKQLVTFLFIFCFGYSVLAQGKKKDQEVDIISHEVQLGESVRLISKKYLVDPAEIYKLNKFAVNGVTQGMVLQIPVPRKEVLETENQNTQTNKTVEETQSDVAVEKVEQKPIEPRSSSKPKPLKENSDATIANESSSSATTHKVAVKETLYSLSKQYGVTVDALKEVNPELRKGLKIGQVITIPARNQTSSDATVNNSATEMKEVASPKATTDISTTDETVTHKVAPKETLYSLSKKYNMTVEEIKQQNATVLQHGLQVGQVLIIRNNK